MDTFDNLELIQQLPLPSHVNIYAGGRWRPGWLIGRVHEDVGWLGTVQYDGDDGTEITAQVPAEKIAPAA